MVRKAPPLAGRNRMGRLRAPAAPLRQSARDCFTMLALQQAGLASRLAVPAACNLGGLLALSPGLLRTLATFTDSLDQQQQAHDKRYVDRLKITARGGKGGNGCTSFYQGASRGEGTS